MCSQFDSIDSSVPAETRDLIQFPLYLNDPGLFHSCLLHFVKVMLHETILSLENLFFDIGA